MIIGTRLRERMEAVAHTERTLSKAVDVPVQIIRRLLAGTCNSYAKIEKLARVLGTTPAYVKGLTDDPESSHRRGAQNGRQTSVGR